MKRLLLWGAGIVFLGFAGLVGAVFLLIVLPLSATESAQAHKATADERAAQVLGKLDADQATAYHAGLEYIRRKHQRIGDFTIGQVIGDARQRNTDAYFARQEVKMRQLDVVSTADLQAAVHLSGSFRDAKIAGFDCSLKIDVADHRWSTNRERASTEKLAKEMCGAAYRLRGSNARDVPDQGLNVYLYDLDGRQLFWGYLDPPWQPPW